MPRSLLLITSLVLHAVSGRWTASPWLVPDLSLIGFAVAIEQAPRQRLRLLLIAVIGVMVLAGPAAARAGAGYAAVGAVLIWFAAQADAPPRALKASVVAAAELLLIAVWWIGDGLAMSLSLLGAATTHLALTVAVWWVLNGWQGSAPARG